MTTKQEVAVGTRPTDLINQIAVLAVVVDPVGD